MAEYDDSYTRRLEAWLSAQPPEVWATIAARVVLRVAPLMDRIRRSDISRRDILLPAFRGLALLWVASSYSTRKFEIRSASATAEMHFKEFHLEIDAAYAVYGHDAFGAHAAGASTTAAFVYASNDSATAKKYAQTIRHSRATDATGGGGDDYDRAEKADMSFIGSGNDVPLQARLAAELAGRNLWPEKMPEWAASYWKNFSSSLLAADEDWQVWTDWYEDRLHGRPAIEALEIARATLPEELWQQGPKVVNARIRELIEEHTQSAKSEISAQSIRSAEEVGTPNIETSQFVPLTTLVQVPLGNRWIPRADFIVIDAAGDDSDDAAARDEATRQLHDSVKRKSIAFMAIAARVESDYGWSGFAAAANRFNAAVAGETRGLPSRVATLYDAAVELGSYLEFDNDLRKRPSGNISPLSADIRRPFTDLVRTYAPWVRRFPTARMLDEETGAFLARPDLFVPAQDIADQALTSGLIFGNDHEQLRGLFASAVREGLPAHKAGVRGILSAKNLVIAALAFQSFYGNAISSDFATKSRLVQKIGDVLIARETQVIKIVSDAPDDIRLAVASLLEKLKQSRHSDGHADDANEAIAILDRRRKNERKK